MKRILLALVPALFAACLVPDQFTMTIDVAKDLSYQVIYEGELVNFLYLEAKAEKKPVDADAAREFDGTAEQLLASPDFVSKKNLGKGRYAVSYRHRGTFQDPRYDFLAPNWSLFNIQKTGPQQLTLSSPSLPENYQQRLSAAGFAGSGTVRIVSDLPLVTSTAGKVTTSAGRYVATVKVDTLKNFVFSVTTGL